MSNAASRSLKFKVLGFSVNELLVFCDRKPGTNKLPNKVAISFYGAETTYGKLNELIDMFAWGLIRLGIKKGVAVSLLMPNCPRFIISYFGILRAGGIVVPLNPMFKHAEIEHEIVDSMAESLIVADYLYPEVERIRDQVCLKSVILTITEEVQ